MQGDYYAVLGVSPASEDVVIRAAYRALMRRYHPDADRSSEATERARLINAAYAVLSDPEQRRRYDGTLAARGLIKLDPQPRAGAGVRVTPAGVAFLALATAAAAAFALAPAFESLPDVNQLLNGGARSPIAAERAMKPSRAMETAKDGCSTDAAKGLIKAELFDRASRLRGSDPSILSPVADRSLVRIDLAEAKGGGGTGTVSCGGWLALDLPTDVAVEGGRRNLNAEIIYALVPAGSAGLRLTALSGVNGLAQSLATLGRSTEAEPEPKPEPSFDLPEEPVMAPVQHPSAEPRRVVPAVIASPPHVRRQPAVTPPKRPMPRLPERTSPASAPAPSRNIAALDKHLALFMAQSVARADATKKSELAASDDRFRKRRDACRTEACQTAAYVGQIRTVSSIMSSGAR